MSRKIATPAAVFAACEALEEAGKPWNRDDVRHAVGGGGYNVIDPLIQAWRKIKPIKSIAPCTPTELLHVIAESIESHLSQYIDGVETRDNERAKAFENSSLNLSEKIDQLEMQAVQYEAQLNAAEDDNQKLQSKMDMLSDKVTDLSRVNAKQQAENDELRGGIQRIEAQMSEEKSNHAEQIKQIQKHHEDRINSLINEHKQQLVIQKRELTKDNELSENRLMRIIDQERSVSKKQMQEHQQTLSEVNTVNAQLKEKNTTLSNEVNRLEIEVQNFKKNALRNQKNEMDALTSTLKELSERINGLEQVES